MIYLTGGPGVGVKGDVKRLRERAILEQRGVGAGGNLCPHHGLTERALVHSDDVEEAQRNSTEVTRNCFETARAAGIDR